MATPATHAQITDLGLLHDAIGAPVNWLLSGSVRARLEAIDGQFREKAVNRDQLLALTDRKPEQSRSTQSGRRGRFPKSVDD